MKIMKNTVDIVSWNSAIKKKSTFKLLVGPLNAPEVEILFGSVSSETCFT